MVSVKGKLAPFVSLLASLHLSSALAQYTTFQNASDKLCASQCSQLCLIFLVFKMQFSFISNKWLNPRLKKHPPPLWLYTEKENLRGRLQLICFSKRSYTLLGSSRLWLTSFWHTCPSSLSFWKINNRCLHWGSLYMLSPSAVLV